MVNGEEVSVNEADYLSRNLLQGQAEGGEDVEWVLFCEGCVA